MGNEMYSRNLTLNDFSFRFGIIIYQKSPSLGALCGVGGIRTLVQTGRKQVFYMLSFLFIVGKKQ